jgi:hypothetical protein
MYINLLLRKPDSTIFKSFSTEDEKIRTLCNRNSKKRTTAEQNIPEAIQHMAGRCSQRIVNYF